MAAVPPCGRPRAAPFKPVRQPSAIMRTCWKMKMAMALPSPTTRMAFNRNTTTTSCMATRHSRRFTSTMRNSKQGKKNATAPSHSCDPAHPRPIQFLTRVTQKLQTKPHIENENPPLKKFHAYILYFTLAHPVIFFLTLPRVQTCFERIRTCH